MELKNAALRYLQIAPERIKVNTESATIHISTLTRSVVFIWALWSGKAQLAIKTLGKSFSQFHDLADLTVYILDNDADSTVEFMASMKLPASGSGETFWIKDGGILHQLADYSDKDLPILERYSIELLTQEKGSRERKGDGHVYH